MTTAVAGDVDKAVIGFLKKALRAEDGNIKIIRVARIEGGWSAEAEVLQENGFIKSLKLPTQVHDRNLYNIILDGNQEVIFYQQLGRAIY